MSSPAAPWSVIVPVKSLSTAKSRLSVQADGRVLPDDVRRDLALAFACDTVAALLACDPVRCVRVVTDDDIVTAAVTALGAQARADPGFGLNAAIVAAIAGIAGPCAAVCADLASATPVALAAVFAAAAAHGRSVLADCSGAGTTVLAAGNATDLHPQFGVNSFARHVAAGCVALTVRDVDAARRDIDTVTDLQAASLLGLGRHTRQALERASFNVVVA